MARGFSDGSPRAIRFLERLLDAVMKRPSAGWALRRNLLVHGVDSPLAFFDLARQYTLKGREHVIQCPTFVCSTVGDDLSANAQVFADRLRCPKTFVRFGVDDDVRGHCEMTGRSLFHGVVFDWLDQVLEVPTTVQDRRSP